MLIGLRLVTSNANSVDGFGLVCGLSSKKYSRLKGQGTRAVRTFSELPILSISAISRPPPKTRTDRLHQNHETKANDALRSCFSGLISSFWITQRAEWMN